MRCETIRRREWECLRKSSLRTNAAIFRNPPYSVGRSDDQWAIPPYKGRALGVREARVQEADEPSGACRGQKMASPADSSLSEGVAHRGSSGPSAASVSAGVPQESRGAGNVAGKGNRVVIAEEDEEAPRARVMEPPVPIKQPCRPVQLLLEESSARVDPLTVCGAENVMPSSVTFSSPHGESLGFQYEKAVVGDVQSETEASGMRGARAAVRGLMIDRSSSASEGGVRGRHGQGGGSHSPVSAPRDGAVGGGMSCLSLRRVDVDPSHAVGAGLEVTECDIDVHRDDDDYDFSGSSNFSRRFFRDALRVKRLLETLERSDASAGGGLGEEETPDRFLDSLGLVEFKPLAQRLVVALESSQESLFGDPCLSVAEPRTNRALRDQVGCLTYQAMRLDDLGDSKEGDGVRGQENPSPV